LLFATFQADFNQYLEIQARLAEKDSLNAWTTPVGSAMFYIPKGAREGDWLASEFF
jgi:dye decolorizing peroxidase